jgi:hypothetical protein
VRRNGSVLLGSGEFKAEFIDQVSDFRDVRDDVFNFLAHGFSFLLMQRYGPALSTFDNEKQMVEKFVCGYAFS